MNTPALVLHRDGATALVQLIPPSGFVGGLSHYSDVVVVVVVVKVELP